MADNKTLNTRLVNKHDVEANWLKAVNFIPLQGEIIVYDIDENYNYERFKIGDGATNISALPFVEDIFKNNLNIKNGTGEKAIQQDGNTASGDHSVAFGVGTVASGNQSVAMGIKTEATEDYGIVVGKFNEAAPGAAVVVGNGNASIARSNAATIDWDGNAWFAGNVSVGENKVLATQEYVDSKTLTDTTLTIEGAAADAKATGDAVELARVKAEIAAICPEALADPNIEIHYDLLKTEIAKQEHWKDASVICEYCPNVTTIGEMAYQDATNLTAAIFPNATTIVKNAFSYCANLKYVYFPKLVNIPYGAFMHTGIVHAEFLAVETIATGFGNAFANCKSLVNVNMPKLKNIETPTAFADCVMLSSVNFPELELVSEMAFAGCTSLKNVDVPKAKTIGARAFHQSGIETLILRNETVCTLANTNAFQETPIANGTGYIYVPAALIEDYKVAANWSIYASQFRALEDYTVDGTTVGKLDDFKVKMTAAIDPTLTISGAPADAKVVGDLWRAYPDDNDVFDLLVKIGIYQRLADEAGAILTDEVDNILLL